MKLTACIIFILFATSLLIAQQYARIDNNNVYIYTRTLMFSDGKQVQRDVLTYTQPRMVIVQENSTEATISRIVSNAKKLKLIIEIITKSGLKSTNLIGSGVPGYMTVSFSYVEGKGWGWYLTCPPHLAPLFYNYWKMTNDDTLEYFQPAQPRNQPRNSPFNY